MEAAELSRRLPTIAENLKEEDAITIQGFDGLDATLKNEGERYRAWRFSTSDLLDLAAECLRRFAWVRNEFKVERKYVEDCLIDGSVLPGKYRVVGVRKVAYQGSYYVIEILRKGYAEAIDWTEAFLVEGHSPRTNEDVRVIEFRYFNPSRVEAARAALKTASFTNPRVQGQELTGAWSASDIVPKQEQDGSYTITLVLKNLAGSSYKYRSLSTMSRVGNTIVYSNWPTKIEAPESTGSGVYRAQNTVNNDGAYDAVLVYECGTSTGAAAFRSMSTMFREGNTVLYKSWPSTIAAPVAAGSGIYRVQQVIQDDGTYDASLIYECGTATGLTPFRSLSTMFRSGNTILYKSWPTLVTSPEATGSGIYRVQQAVQDDGTYDASLIYECGTATGSAQFKSLSTMFRSGNTILYKSWPSVITSPESTGSGIYRVQQTLQDDGTYDGALLYECGAATGAAAFKSLSTMFRSGNTILYKSWPSLIIAPEAKGSGIYRVQQVLQDDGTYDASLLYECGTATGSAAFRSLSTFFRAGNSILYKSWPSAISAPEATGSGIYRVQQALQDDGTYDGSLIYECGTATGTAEFKSMSTLFRSGNTVLYKSWPSAIASPEATGSGVYRVQQSLQDDGTYDAILLYECGTATGSSAFKSFSTVMRSGSTILYKSWPSAIQSPDASAGGVYRVQQSLQDDGTYDAVMLYEAGDAKSVEFIETRGLLRLGSAVLYKSWPTKIDAPNAGAGGIYRVQQSIQDDGTYDGSMVYDARLGSQVQISALKSTLGTMTNSLYRGQDAVRTIPANSQGKIVTSSLSISDDGTYDQDIGERQSSSYAIFKSWNTVNGVAYMYNYRNWPDVVTVDDADNNVGCHSTINDDGTYDCLISITPPGSSGGGGDWSDSGTEKTALCNLYGPKGISAQGPGRYIVYVYMRKTYSKAEGDVKSKIASPDSGYQPVPSYGAYHTGIWVHGRKAYQGVVVLQKYPP